MREIHRSDVNFQDVLEFVEFLYDRKSIVYSPAGFDNDRDVIIVRAPARLDLMGGIADYCGSNVFEATLSNSLVIGSQLRDDRQLKVLSIDAEKDGLNPEFCLSMREFYSGNNIKEYKEIERLFRKDPRSSWVGYCLGAFYVLLKENKVSAFKNGLTMVIKSDIPMGAGISSSAALEIATMASIVAQYRLDLDSLELARLAQITENKVVGAPCGIMDQITSAVGEEGRIISILCQPGEILEWVDLPENVRLLGINSGVRRSTGGSAYIDTRTAAFMGLTIISAIRDQSQGNREPSDPRPPRTRGLIPDPLNGYLCNVSVGELRKRYWKILPKRISGREFLDRYGETIDPFTTVDPDKVYMVRSRSEHPVYENRRVRKFIEYLKAANTANRGGSAPVCAGIRDQLLGNRGSPDPYRLIPDPFPEELVRAGKIMYASHWSYRQRVGLGSRNVDIIVNRIRDIGLAGGFLGAKITGGGAGGTAAVLCYGDVSDSLCAVLDHYKSETGIDAQLLTGSSPGAFKSGYLRHVISNR